MEAQAQASIFKLNPKHDSQQVLQILQALKQASHVLQQNPDADTSFSSSSAIKALLELEHESESILCNDPHLTLLSTHLTALKSCNERQPHHGPSSFLTRLVNSVKISKLAGLIESQIQAWIDREVIKTLTVHTTDETILIDLIQRFDERIASGFDRDLQDSILRSRVFNKLESILCDCRFSNNVRETAAFAISELVGFNKDVFVGLVLMSETVSGLMSLASVRSIQILCTLIRSIKSPLVDELVSNNKIPKILGFLDSEQFSIRAMAMDCVLEIGYFGRKEAIDVMLEQGLVKKLVELQRCEIRGVNNNNDNNIEVYPFASCVARFAVQLEVGEGLRGREKRELKQEMLKRVREGYGCDAEGEGATIVAEVLWGASP